MERFCINNRMRFGNAGAATRGLSYDAPICGDSMAVAVVAARNARVVSDQDSVNSV